MCKTEFVNCLKIPFYKFRQKIFYPNITACGAGVGLVAAVMLAGCGEAPGPEPERPQKPQPDLRQLRVGAVYNDDKIQIRFEFNTDQPGWYHDYLVYQDGAWKRYGQAEGLYEDRISMMLDDGSVEYFAQAGGFVTAHSGMRSLDSEVGRADVENHPYLGGDLGESDVRKFIMESREGDPDAEAWERTKPVEELEELRRDGVFIDLWQWRAHRSNPLGYADNGYVLDYRHGAEGRGPYTTNWDEETETPKWIFDAAATGFHALDREALLNREYGQDDYYYLAEDLAVPFDPDHEWREGDTLPRRLLREPSGSRGAIRADGRYEEGAWRVRLTRSLEAPDPKDSKTLADGGLYHVAFSVHADATGARWHWVSVPLTLGLGTHADIEAEKVEGDLNEAEVAWTPVTLFQPGQVTWDWLYNDEHPGFMILRSGAMDLSTAHSMEEILQNTADHERQLQAR